MINVKNLFHSYGQNEKYQVNDISFDVNEAEIFGFLGPNGAGKSTTQKILTSLLPCQNGEVNVLGKDIRQVKRDWFNQIGVCFEQPNLYKKLSGLENLQFFRGLFEVETQDPVSLLNLFGLSDAVNKRVGAYSKGMTQRLMLARSLLNHPKLWFLDEPTSGLDPASAQMVKELIIQQKQSGTTIFLTTHNMHDAEELCDRVAFLNNGKIVALDSPRNLKLKYGEKALRVEYRVNGRVESERLLTEKEDHRKRLQQLLEDNKVETIHTLEASLDAIFVQLTGRGLE